MDENPAPSDATRSAAQSRLPPRSVLPIDTVSGEGVLFAIGPRLRWAHCTRSYCRQKGDPLYRPLSIFALDPSVSKLQGAIARVEIPYEPLGPGPEGALVKVVGEDAAGRTYIAANLDTPSVLIGGGYPPSISRPEFHQQMVYAVAMTTYHRFRLALGRDIAWAFAPDDLGETKLTLRPFGEEATNAWYDSGKGEIVFGYFAPERDTPVAPAKHGLVYTSLSHDIIVHEMSHALLDGLRAHFLQPSHPDVPAFHEAFADLVALFEHFTHHDAVRSALAEHRGQLTSARTLVSLAVEFGRGLGAQQGALRTFADMEGEQNDAPLTYSSASSEPHDRGKVLARAVFDAFIEIYQRRTRRFIKLGTRERAVLEEGDLPATLEDLLVEEVQKLSQQFCTICIRAIDYCPPVDLRFGDYLRAIVTADRDLVPDDPLGYRETLIRAFGRRGIYGEGTRAMTEDALAWNGTRILMRLEGGLKLGHIAISGGFAEPANNQTLAALAGELGRLLAEPTTAREVGLISPLDREFSDDYALPTIESIRIARRVGPDKQITFDLIAEVTQKRVARSEDGASFDFFGGATLIIDCFGEVRFSISKRIDHAGREEAQWQLMRSVWGASFWEQEGKCLRPVADLSRRLCVQDMSRRSTSPAMTMIRMPSRIPI